MGSAVGWHRQRRSATAASLCDAWPEQADLNVRSFAHCHVLDTALVIGSTQPEDTISAQARARDGLAVVRRPAGGGAVLVAPLAQVWIDFWIPRQDDLWEDDVVRSGWWLGETWASALSSLGAEPPQVHRGASIVSEVSRLICFAGLGPGEVTIGGSKVVGIAQRRTRRGARLLSVAELSWEPSSIVGLLSGDHSDTVRRTRKPEGSRKSQESWESEEMATSATGLRAVLPESRSLGAQDLIRTVEDAVERFLP